jgi:hypothetical protein
MDLHLNCFCPLDEYREFLKISRMIMLGRLNDRLQKTALLEDRRIDDFLSFSGKLLKGSGVVSDQPGREIFICFECTMCEYDTAIFVLQKSAIYYSKFSENNDKNTEMAILSVLMAKRLRDSLVLPDLKILLDTETGIFLKDLDKGNITITNSAELVCRIFAESKRIFYEDTEQQWAELVHDNGAFKHFAPIVDDEINQQIKANLLCHKNTFCRTRPG